MSSKRHEVVDYAEESYTDEDEEIEMEREQKMCAKSRSNRPRKASLTTNSSMETVTSEMPGRRRGRGPSKRPCLNKNALMARENRQRKKEYMERIESKLQFYQHENQELNNTIKKQSIEIKRLANEVDYLKTVLNNNTIVTSLLKAMNDSLKRMHGNNNATAAVANSFDKQSTNVGNWFASEQSTQSKTRSTVKDSLEVSKEKNQKSHFGQIKIARKTMPFTNIFPKSENPSSVESILEEDEKLSQKSPQSGSYCEYNTVKSSVGLDNQLPTTPMSIMSSSVDKGEASLSDTDFSQLSSFNVDLFEHLNEVTNPLQFGQENPDIFNEDTVFLTLENGTSISNNEVVDPLEIGDVSDRLNEKTLFNTLQNTGVCLHINSSRVSLEYCSICHSNSLKSKSV